ncbi:MAG: homoserine kinase [Planctomycetes bacterium]|nr:homoserine kinase [Planctomycetota bacterium]
MALPHSVRIPASTSNLGPGFDLLGLALDLFLTVELDCTGDGGDRFESLAGEATGLPQGPHNLLTRAFLALFERLGKTPPTGRTWRVDSEIPVARGLGSSGASTAAGLLLACQVLGMDPADHSALLIRLGTELEGHPDNVVASLLGGCVLTIQSEPEFQVIRQTVHPDLAFAVAWGQTPLPTSKARACLPGSVPFAEALDQPRRLAALLEGLRTADPILLGHARTEHLHQEARMGLIPGAREALQAAHGAGAYLATISGSGSSLIAIGSHERGEAMAEALGRALDQADGPAVWRLARPV